MKHPNLLFSSMILAALVAFTLTSCKGPSSPVTTEVTVQADHSLSNEDVFLIFTNYQPYASSSTVPLVLSNARILEDTPGIPRFPRIESDSDIIDARIWEQLTEPVIDTSAFRILEQQPIQFAYYDPEDDVPGRTLTFSGAGSIDTEPTISATCRKIVTDTDTGGFRTLSIFVADTAWNEYGGADKDAVTVDQDMIDALADRFFNTSAGDNDIWDWSVDIFGEPWGPVPVSHPDADYLLDDGSQNDITILLYDIEGTGDTSGGVVGYFDANDNYTDGPGFDAEGFGSDQRLLFAIDSTLYATVISGEGSWSTENYWPRKVFSTLTHEFQHMIHYYQKEIVFSTSYYSETWLNEMCSMVAEDLIARRLGIEGPRGVDPDEASAGTRSTASSNRLSDYNYYPETSLTDWDYNDVYPHYAASYAFGAYIARNYGGAELFADIVQNSETGFQAVIDAIYETTGDVVTVESLLIEWAIATFDSEEIATESTYNRGDTWITSDGSVLEYTLGSINLDNYLTTNDSGTDIYGPVPFATEYFGMDDYGWDTSYMPKPGPASNTVIQVGDNLVGDYSWTVRIPENMTVRVFTR